MAASTWGRDGEVCRKLRAASYELRAASYALWAEDGALSAIGLSPAELS